MNAVADVSPKTLKWVTLRALEQGVRELAFRDASLAPVNFADCKAGVVLAVDRVKLACNQDQVDYDHLSPKYRDEMAFLYVREFAERQRERVMGS